MSHATDSFVQVIDKLRFLKTEYGLEVNADIFSDALIKRMAQTNTIYADSSHQTHIAMTGSEMEMFPYPNNYLYLEQGDIGFKRHYLLKIPITLLKNNLEYLAKNVSSQFQTQEIAEISRRLNSYNEKEIQTYTTCVRSKRQRQPDQIELGDMQNDDEWLINFRWLIFEGDFLIFLRKKRDVHYYLVGIKKDDAAQKNLGSILGYYCSPDKTVFLPELVRPKVEELEILDDAPLTLPSEEDINTAINEVQKTLLMDEKTIREIIAHLVSGKNVILSGPIGTGKTHLAMLIPKLVWKNLGGYCPFVYTATADWTTQDVIGGILPKLDENRKVIYRIHKGCVYETVSRNWDRTGSFFKRCSYGSSESIFKGVWLVIDEFNRANLDRAFGEMFTAIEHYRLKVPTIEDKAFDEIPVPKDYRILGTLNTFDKHYLFKLSDALKRRFAFVDISPPSRNLAEEEKYYALKRSLDDLAGIIGKDKIEKIKLNHETKKIEREGETSKTIKTFDTAYDLVAFIRLSKNLGTSILISIYKYILTDRQAQEADYDKSLDAALTSNVLPQLEGVPRWSLETIRAFCCENTVDFFKSKKADDLNFPKYVDEFKKLLVYLGKDEVQRRSEAYMKGQIQDQHWPSYDPWAGKERPALSLFSQSLGELIRELELL